MKNQFCRIDFIRKFVGMDFVRVVDPFAKGLSVLWKKDLKVSFVDLGYIGYPFTWVNRHMGDGIIKERLDRVLVPTEWRAWWATDPESRKVIQKGWSGKLEALRCIRITGVHKENGDSCEDQGEEAAEFVAYFQKLFQSEGSSEFEEILNAIESSVTANMNHTLTQSFSNQEIKQALINMDPSKLKSPRS
ncbi:hypothetical protein RHSIM_Rhsim06G0060400 [Rhododendron simsii]|uniref:Uncharacterized protein n=1 Tax=Rhododendron simsii TaxID=118357 RepID=A0A834LNF6_RHOSS|nr:hypothetical protein RHSIM_Rhsim06G0060400 [Rhododendron simsii]